MWDEIRNLFPIHKHCVYLNNAGVAPPSVRVLEALESFHGEHARFGWKQTGARHRDVGPRIKAILSDLIRCPPERIALTHNTSEGMSIIAQGLSWQPGDGILGLDEEYPANVYPWMNLESRGVRFIRVKPTHTEEDAQRLIEKIDHRIRLVSVSRVDWCTGAVLDLAALGRACRDSGTLLVADMAQALGIVELDPERMGIAAMAGSAWKWLMGPVGLGIFTCSENFMNQIELSFVGTDTVRTKSLLDYDFTPKGDASRFEFSTANYNDWVYFLASLELLREIGFQAVRERILFLKSYLRDGLSRKGYEIRGAQPAREESGIIAFMPKGRSAHAEAARLASESIIVMERSGAVRISPHIYNNEEDLDRLLHCLP